MAATRAEPTRKADRTAEAEPTPKAAAPRADAASTAGPRDETAETARTAAKPKDDDSGEPAASGAKPAAAATSEATSGSADAEPDKSAKTAKPAEQDDTPPAARDSDTDSDQQRQVTVVPGVPRYHTDNCILIRFMDDDDVQQMSLKAATGAGCTPCGACQPDH